MLVKCYTFLKENLYFMDYSKAVKRIREEQLLTQVELATELGVSFATVNRWEKGHHQPTIKQKRALRDYCKKNRIVLEEE